MTDSDWVTVKLPKELAAEIDRVRKRQNLGYTSRAELVKEAVRSYLVELKKN
jgi:metal-responsive CopG/Arc/MetJ family transcriptional regulator